MAFIFHDQPNSFQIALNKMCMDPETQANSIIIYACSFLLQHVKMFSVEKKVFKEDALTFEVP